MFKAIHSNGLLQKMTFISKQMALISRRIISTCVISKLFIYGIIATICDGLEAEQSIIGGVITSWNENYTLD